MSTNSDSHRLQGIRLDISSPSRKSNNLLFATTQYDGLSVGRFPLAGIQFAGLINASPVVILTPVAHAFQSKAPNF